MSIGSRSVISSVRMPVSSSGVGMPGMAAKSWNWSSSPARSASARNDAAAGSLPRMLSMKAVLRSATMRLFTTLESIESRRS